MDSVIEEIVKKHWKELRKKKNVIAYSGTLKSRIKYGLEYPEEQCFRVYVIDKVRLDNFPMKDSARDKISDFLYWFFRLDRPIRKKDLLPLCLEGIPIDIIPQGMPRALEVCRTRNRPVKAGCSAMNYKGGGCTLGYFAINRKEREEPFLGVICNNHCGARENLAKKREAYLYPSPADSGTILDKIAEHWRHVNIKFDSFTCPYREFFYKLYRFFKREETNVVDASLERITIPENEVSLEIFKIGKVLGKRRGELGELGKKAGRTTGLTEGGKFIDEDWNGYVNYGRGKAFFSNCGLLQGKDFCAGGDSSSAVIWSKDNYIGGLLFAGSGPYTIFCHFDNIENLLKVEIVV